MRTSGGSRSLRRTVVGGTALWLVTLIGLRAVVVQPERCGDPSSARRTATATAAVDWLVINQRPDGSWLYRYDRSTDTDVGGYNIVRHAGVMMSLEQAATFGIDGAAESADQGLAWATDNLYQGPGFLALAEPGRSVRVGATGLLVAALVHRRDRTDDHRHDALLHDLGAFLVTVVNERGQVHAEWSDADQAPVPDSWSPFFTGEVFWAIALLHRTFPDEGYDHVARRIADYVATERDDVEGRWPDIPDHWAAYGFAVMTTWPGGADLTADHLSYIERQMGFQSMQIRWESQRTNTFVSHYTRGRQTLGAGLGTVGEALDNWSIVVAATPALAGLADDVAERARSATGVLIGRQARSADDPAEHGAWFQFDITQMDDQQHALSAVLYAPDSGPGGDR